MDTWGICSVNASALRTLFDAMGAVASMVIIKYNSGELYLYTKSQDPKWKGLKAVAVLRTPVHPQAFCSKLHIPTSRSVLKMAHPREGIHIDCMEEETVLRWRQQTHRMPHLSLSVREDDMVLTESLAEFELENTLECLRFCREIVDSEVHFVSDGDKLLLTNPGDLCTSTLRMKTKSEVLPRFNVVCNTADVVKACKSNVYAPSASLVIHRTAVIFYFERSDGHLKVVVPAQY